MLRHRPPPAARDRGAGLIEYAALVTLVLAVLVGLVAVGLPTRVSGGTERTVCRIFDENCKPGEGAANGQGGNAGPEAGLGPGGQIGSFLRNFGRAAVDAVKGTIELVKNPALIRDAIDYIRENPLDALRQLVWDDETRDLWDLGDYGGAIGRTVFNVGSLVFSPAAVLKAAKLGALSKLGKLGKGKKGIPDPPPKPQQAPPPRANIPCVAGAAGALRPVPHGPAFGGTLEIHSAALVYAGCYQVPYGGNELSRFVQAKRLADKNRKNTYAAVRLKNGEIKYEHSSLTGHAEEKLVKKYGKDNIAELYVELEPCNVGKNCKALTAGIPTTYSWPWPNDAGVRAGSQAAKDQAIRELFNRKRPGP